MRGINNRGIFLLLSCLWWTACGDDAEVMVYDLDVAMAVVDTMIMKGMSSTPESSIDYADSLIRVYAGKEPNMEALLNAVSVFSKPKVDSELYASERVFYEKWVWEKGFTELDYYVQYRICSSLYTYYKTKKEYKKAISVVMRGQEALLNEPQRFEWEIGVCYVMIADCTTRFIPSDYSQAQDMLLKAAQLFEKRNIHISAFITHGYIAGLYARMGNHTEEAVRHADKALGIHEAHLPERESYAWEVVMPTKSYGYAMSQQWDSLSYAHTSAKRLLDAQRISAQAYDNFTILSLEYYLMGGLEGIYKEEFQRLSEKFLQGEDSPKHQYYAGLLHRAAAQHSLLQSDTTSARKHLLASLERFDRVGDNLSDEKSMEALNHLIEIDQGKPMASIWYQKKVAALEQKEVEKKKNVEELNYWVDKNIAYEENQYLRERKRKERAQMQLVLLSLLALLVVAFSLPIVHFYRKLKSKNKQLDAQTEIIQEQNEELANLVARLSSSNEDLKNFASIAAHDLKAPLRTISSFSAILQRKYDAKILDKDKDLFEFIIDSCNNLQEIINGLLRFSSAGEENAGPTAKVDMERVALKVLALLHKNIDEKGASVEVLGKMPVVKGHSNLLEQLLLNLLNNALKFSKQEEAPEITIFAGAISKGYVEIGVRDNGIGIQAKNRKEIFQMFRRLHSSSEYKGAGIGLSTCRKIVERYGGQIRVDSELGEGSTFYFTLPLANTEFNSQSDETSPPTSAAT